MIEIIPASSAAHFSQEQALFGALYTLEFEWIQREKVWTVHIYDGAHAPIALGLKISTEWPIFVNREKNWVLRLFSSDTKKELDVSNLRDFSLIAHEIV
ncbi:MAG: hypothetical protein KC505_11105 [Myxococcales bacterium]|nr:hypothetical protein [Myxococcales bacterium]